MPPTTESPIDAAFFLNVLFHLENGKVNWAAVAQDNGVTLGRNAPAKFNNLAKKYGYKWEAGKLIRIDGSDTASGSATNATAATSAITTPSKSTRETNLKRKRGLTVTSKTSAATPTKNRKVRQVKEDDEEAEDEVAGLSKATMKISTDDEAEED